MRPVDGHVASRLKRTASSLCTCWRIQRQDGDVVGVTDHDSDVTFLGTTFVAAGGASGSALEGTVDLAPDNSEIVGIFSVTTLDACNVDAGVFDDAEIEIWRVDWEDPSARILLRSGVLGNIRREGEGYRAEFRSLKNRLDQTTGRVYGRTCDAQLGDNRCGIDLNRSGFRVAATVVSADGSHITVRPDEIIAEDFFRNGTLVPHTGRAAGRPIVIRSHGRDGENERLVLWAPPSGDVVAGTPVTVEVGCDQRRETCSDRFGNILNFRGFPFIPGSDVLTATPLRGKANS